jgi:hypothetical protein
LPALFWKFRWIFLSRFGSFMSSVPEPIIMTA